MPGVPVLQTDLSLDDFREYVGKVAPSVDEQAGALGIRKRTLQGYLRGEFPIPATVGTLARLLAEREVCP